MPSDFNAVEVGSSGLERSGGFVTEEFHPRLRGIRAARTFLEMRQNDPIVGAILFGLDMVIRQVKWDVKPVSKDQADVDAADFLKSCMGDMSMTWSDTISEVLSMLPFGWAWHELVYKVRRGPDETSSSMRSKYTDGRIGWRKIALRAQETLYKWEFDESGGIEGMWQQAPPNYAQTYIPIKKALLFRTSVHKNNPEGRSVLRNAYRPWYFKKRIEEIEAIGIERDLAGLPVMWVDPRLLSANATAAEQAILAEYKKVVVNVRRDEQEGLVLPAQYDNEGRKLFDFQLMSAGGSRQFDTSTVIGRKNQEIAMTVLADFILLGHERVGSFALSSDKTDLFALAVGSWLDMIADVFNTHAVPKLFGLNDFQVEEFPKISHGDIETPDLGTLGNFVQVLTAAGVPLFPDAELENYLREVAAMPPKPSDEATLAQQQEIVDIKTGVKPPATAQAAPTGPGGNGNPVAKPKGKVPEKKQQAAESPAAGVAAGSA